MSGSVVSFQSNRENKNMQEPGQWFASITSTRARRVWSVESLTFSSRRRLVGVRG